MTAAPLLSVCMTIKDRSLIETSHGLLRPFLACIKALRQAVDPATTELVVADWGSTDWPLQTWLDEASGDLPVVIVLASGPFSRGGGLNAAARHARGSVFFFLDTDTLVDREVIEAGLAAVRAGKAFFPVVRYAHESGETFWARRGFGNCMMHRDVLRFAGLWPAFQADSEDVLFHRCVAEFVDIERPEMPGLFHPWHPIVRPPAFAFELLQREVISREDFLQAVQTAQCPTQVLVDRGLVVPKDFCVPYVSAVEGMRFAFVADVPGWALAREGLALCDHHGTDHVWETLYGAEECLSLDGYDLVRIGSVPLVVELANKGLLPSGRRTVVSVASYHGVCMWQQALAAVLDRVVAFVVLDRRLVSQVVGFGRPILYAPDRCDSAFFYPVPELQPAHGTLRVGWAGSERTWGTAKHVAEIAEACARADVEFVRRDREKDGPALDDAGLRTWYNGLDVYVAANDVDTLTPITTLEAASCGVTVATTRCGELWPLFEAHLPETIIDVPTVDSIASTLSLLKRIGRPVLAQKALEFRDRYWRFLDCKEEAQRFTETMVALRLSR